MRSVIRRFVAVAMALGLLAGAAGCGDDGSDTAGGDDNSQDTSSPAEGADASDDATGESADDEAGSADGADDEGQDIDLGRDNAVSAIMSGTGAVGMEPDSVEWENDTIRLIYDEGSVNGSTATIVCPAVESSITDEESGVIVFPDGEVPCDE